MRLTDEAKAELRRIEDRRGRLTPEQVVQAAEPEDSALHACFEWDNDAAGHAWRIEQARELIRRVRIEVTVEERTFRVVRYVRDPQRGPSEAGYMATMKVQSRSVADMMRAELGAVSADLSRVCSLADARSAALPGLAAKVRGIKDQVDRLAEGL